MVDYEELKKLAIVRLESMPSNLRISMGSLGTFSREELVEMVRKDEKFGRIIVNMQHAYLKSMKTGFSNV